MTALCIHTYMYMILNCASCSLMLAICSLCAPEGAALTNFCPGAIVIFERPLFLLSGSVTSSQFTVPTQPANRTLGTRCCLYRSQSSGAALRGQAPVPELRACGAVHLGSALHRTPGPRWALLSMGTKAAADQLCVAVLKNANGRSENLLYVSKASYYGFCCRLKVAPVLIFRSFI